MSNLPRIRRVGWLLVAGAAIILLLTLLISFLGGNGFGFFLVTLLVVIVPIALAGSALLAYHWLKISKRTGRRL